MANDEAKGKMTLKSVPNSLKRIRTVVDEVKERDGGISPAEKFDLRMAQMYLEYLKVTVDGLLEDEEE